MASLGNKRKLAAINRENHEDSSRSNSSWNTSVPGIQECITQVSEEIERKVTKKMSWEFSRRESLILGAPIKLDEFLLSPQVWVHSGFVPKTSRNSNG